MTACLSHGGQNVFRSAAPSVELLVGTTQGLFLLRRPGNGQADWQIAGRSLEGKHVSAMLVERRSGKLFAGTHGDGLHVSANAGETWRQIDGPSGLANIYCVASAEWGGETRLYAGTEPVGLYVSADGGESWQDVPSVRNMPSTEEWFFLEPPFLAHLKSIALDPRTPETIFAGVEQGAVLKSVDAGRTWQELTGLYLDPHRMVMLPSQPDTIFVTGGQGVYLTRDAGRTWEHLSQMTRVGYPDPFVIHPEREEIMYTAGAKEHPGTWIKTKSADAHIVRSRDGGASWEVLGRGLPERIEGNIEAMVMEVWPGGFSLFAGTTDGRVFFSGDEGENWTTIASGLPPISKAEHYLRFTLPSRPESAEAAGGVASR